MADAFPVAATEETGSLGIYHLKRLWSSAQAARMGGYQERPGEAHQDQLLLNALGLGIHQVLHYLHLEAPDFPTFEAWVVATAGRPDPQQVARLNADLAGRPSSPEVQRWLAQLEASAPVLSEAALRFWEAEGYLVLKHAISEEAAAATAAALYDHLGADPAQPDTWYGKASHGIMVEWIQHPLLEANRRSLRIHKAFAQLWGTADLWVSADRCAFHPPQRPGWPFPGPDLHWDVDFREPVPFCTQGLLYLTDTPPEQGALTLVPGFHKRLDAWLDTLAPGADPQQQDLHALGSVPIGGAAGDMVIWHQALPHGSRPNRGLHPRLVQYINFVPGTRRQNRTDGPERRSDGNTLRT